MRAIIAGIVFTASAGGCASTGAGGGEVNDPLEPLNRRVFAFNEAADRAVIGPAADAYVAVTPGFARTGVSNAVSNLNSPVVFANDVLQGEPERAAETFYRFLVNSTLGVLGLFDPAAEFGVEGHSEDFGQTLAVWGVGEGPFLVLPLMGPSNLRDASGRGVDAFIDPLNTGEINNDEDLTETVRWTSFALGLLQTRVEIEPQLESLRDQPEPYVAMRRAYTSQRQAAVRNGRAQDDPYKDLPDFDDFE
ncbi:MAG: VacJ family lipoprotein [Alphaproteobacteria bacterium]|jgi:phospholipid-binding lipoprotein MlaA|nr:VacJ family lipoprotein [Alphaproteobacteria bacterium]